MKHLFALLLSGLTAGAAGISITDLPTATTLQASNAFPLVTGGAIASKATLGALQSFLDAVARNAGSATNLKLHGTLTFTNGAASGYYLRSDGSNAAWAAISGAGAGETNVLGTSGTGHSLVTAKTNFTLYTKSLTAGSNINITADTNNVTIEATNLISFYGNERLKELVSAGAYELTVLLRDSNDVVTNATVLWPDGTYGVFLCTSNNPTWLTVDSYTITYTNAGKTITQSTVLRNATGAITNKPALTISL
jgi:hypothetical protein